MIKQTVFNDKYPKNNIEVLQCRTDSSAEGEILLDVDRLDEVLECSTSVYLCDAPNCLTDKWVRSGADLYTSDIFNLEVRKLSTGRNKLLWRFSPNNIPAEDETFYAINILINSSSNSEESKASIEFIVKIKNSIGD